MAEHSAQNVMDLPRTGLNSLSSPPSLPAPKKIILDRKKVQLKMEKIVPEEFLDRSAEEMKKILDEEYEKWEKINEEIMAEREVWFKEFQKNLEKDSLLNDLIEDVCEHRLPRLRYAKEWIDFLAERLPQYMIPLTRAEFEEQHKSLEDDPSLPSRPTILRGCRIYFSDGELAVSWMPRAIDEFHRGVPDHEPLEPQLSKWDAEFEKAYPAHESRKNDGRHPNGAYHAAQKAYFDANELGHGVGHFGHWHCRCHEKDQTWNDSGPWCHVLSEDASGGPKSSADRDAHREAFVKYQLRLIPVEEALGAFYKALATEKFTKSREQREFMVNEFTKYGLETLPNVSEYQCHLFMARVKNKSVKNHRDEGDFGLAVETCFGNFAGGDFCLPELNERLYFRAGDFLVMNAKVLAHCVAHFDGERTSIVFTSKRGPESRLPHVNYMDDGPEREAILAAKKERDEAAASAHRSLQQDELELIQEYLGDKASIDEGKLVVNDSKFPSNEDEYKLFHVHLDAKRLEHALKVKNKALKAAETAEEDEEIDETPASLYYEYKKKSRELERAGKGLNPFLSQEQQKEKFKEWKKNQKVAENAEGEQVVKGGRKRKAAEGEQATKGGGKRKRN